MSDTMPSTSSEAEFSKVVEAAPGSKSCFFRLAWRTAGHGMAPIAEDRLLSWGSLLERGRGDMWPVDPAALNGLAENRLEGGSRALETLTTKKSRDHGISAAEFAACGIGPGSAAGVVGAADRFGDT